MWKTYLLCTFAITCVSCNLYNEVKILSQWRDFPLKTLMNLTIVQPECNKAYRNFLKLLNDYDLSALKMLDATAKLPSGILNGNIIQYGDFDACMEVPSAQYCLAEIDLESLWQKPYSKFEELVHAFYFFKENFEDPAHRIPGFKMVRWGFCIPQECTAQDLEKSLESNMNVRVQIRAGMCQKTKRNDIHLSFGDYAARMFFGFIIVAVILSSSVDYSLNYLSQETKNKLLNKTLVQFLMCFSLTKNIAKFCELKEKTEIAGLHGIRALNVLALLLSHKSVSLFFNPFMNRTATVVKLSKPWTIIAKNAIVYTDTFMLLSGLLNANALLTDLKMSNTIKFNDKLINRLFRILPNLIAIILFCTYILPFMGSGPLWPTIIDHHAFLCKRYMWRNLVFIHNYFGFENMCLTHTHQLGIDMQLFLITPILIYLIWNHKKIGFMVLAIITVASAVLRFWIAYKYELNSVIYFGITVSKMFQMANLSYILPTHRATIYLIGVLLAYFLKFSKNDKVLNKFQIVSLWCVFLPMFLWAWLGFYHMVLKDYVYDKIEGSIVTATYPFLWGFSVSFGIYAINKNIAGWFGKFLCWPYFKIITKLAYAVYLVQFPVFFYNVGVTKNVEEYQPFLLLQFYETLVILFLSLLLVLLIEMPFQNIKLLLFNGNKKHQFVLKKKTKMDFKRDEYKLG